jgi:NADH-quinone oxidoreductase subunit E
MTKDATKFSFNDEHLMKAQTIIGRYPEGRQKSALLPLLDLAQRQSGGWLPHHAIEYVAEFLSVPFMRAYEVATFYTMFNLKPVGKNHIQVCTTTPCWLRGSSDIVKICEDRLSIKCGEVSNDNEFSLIEVECLGACVNAPMVQINDDYFEDLTPESMTILIDKMKNGDPVTSGSQIGRCGSAPKAAS